MPTPDHLQNPDTPEIIITRDDDKIADILARQSYRNEDNPHVGYSQTISDGGVRGKEHLIRNIFYDDKPVGFATATLSTGEGNLFALLADNAYQESFLLDVPVSSYDRAADAWEGIADKELDGYYDHGCMLFSDEEQMIDFYEAHRPLIDYRNERFEQIHSLAQTDRSAAERLSLALPVNEVTDIKAVLTRLSDNALKEATDANKRDDDFISLSPDTRFQFIGEIGAAQLDNAARSFDILLALATAKEMTEAGKDALSVKMATGWEQGADAKWRYELPDIQMPEYSLSLLRDGHADGRPVTLGELLPQAPFLNAYPDMASMPVITDRERPKGAAYNPETRQITISVSELHIFDTEDLNAMSVSETLLHEIQHAIQHAEGFATGGNIQTVANQQRLEAEKEMAALHDIYKAYETIDFRTLSADTHEALMAYEERDRYERQYEQELKAYILARQKMETAELDLVAGRLSEKNYQNYRSLAGEVEARNTVARAGMTPEERRRTLAAATEDVARESQRVIFSGASCLIREPQAALLHNDIVLRDKLVSLMQHAGIPVNTDWREGQAVLDTARPNARLQNAEEKNRNIPKDHRAYFDESVFNIQKTEADDNGIRFFLTSQGDAYGFTHGDTIYIDPRIATSETPIHEYAHLWAQAMRQNNPEEWQNIISLMKQVTPVWEMVQSQYTHLSSDSDIAEEVLAQYSGRQGMKQLQRALNSHAPGLSNEQSRDILDRIKAAIDRFWQKTADFLHIHYHSADEVASRVMHDLLHQVNPQRLSLQTTARSPENSNNIPYAAVPQQPAPHVHTTPSQQPKGEGIPSPSADNSLSTGDGQGETSSPLATNKPTRHNAQADGTILAYSTAPYDEVRTLAHGIKEGDTAAIKEAARRMADIINAMPDKEKVILVPMPSHEGHATYTKALADEIARLTGSRTADCLHATPHPSLYDLKKSRGIERLPSPQLRLDESAATKETLQDRIPVIIDNVLDTGTTAVAAAKAFGEKTDVRIAVLGNTRNFYLFDNHIELADGGKRNNPLSNTHEKAKEHTHDKTGKEEKESLSSLPPSADNTAAPYIAPSQRPSGFQFQLIGTKGAAEMDRSDGRNRLDHLMMAMVMEKQDKRPLEIKIATGWERGADGKWRHEIPDIQINPNHFAAQWVETYNKYWNAVKSSSAENFRTATQPYTQQLDRLYENFKKEHRLRDILSPDSPVLKAYPQIGDFRLKIYNSGKGGGGYYDTRTDTVHLNLYGRPDARSIAGTLAHEIQHAIQYMEGFAYGAPLRKASEVAELQRQFHRLEDDIDDIGKEKAKLFHQLYSLPGWSQRTHIAYYKVTDENHKGFGDDILRADPELSRQLIDGLRKSQPLVYRLGVELIKQIEAKEERMLKMMDEMVEIDKKMSSPDRNHTVSAGEVEARNVRARMDMTPEKRKRTLAESTEDVARMFQKVSYDYLLSANEQQDTNRNNPKNHTTMPTHDQHRDYLQDFLDGKSRLQAAKAEMNLNKVVRFEMPDRTNRVMTNAEFIQYALDNNLTVAATPEKGNFPEAKAAEIERAFSGFNENIVRRNLGSHYKATPEMKAFEQLLQRMFLARNEEKPSNEEYFKARNAAIDSIIDANTPKKMYYHVQYDSNGASMAISKTMYDYAAFIQKASIENLTRQLTDLLSEPQFNEWLHKHEEGVVLISEADILRLKDGQLQLGWYHMPEGSRQPEFITDDLAKRDFHQQVNILLEGIENATALHRDMQVESLLQQLDADRISLEEPMTVRLTKGETVTISDVAQDKPGHDTYLVSDEGKPYTPYYVNSDDFNKVADKAIEDGTQQLLVRQNGERMEPALAEMRQQLLTLMQDEKLMHFIAPFPEVRLSVGKDGEIYLKDGELRINDFDHNGRQYDILLAEERPHVQLTDLQEALQTAHVFQARMQLLENMEAADVNQATLQPNRDLTVRLRGWEETGDTHQVASLHIEDNHFRVTDTEGNSFPSYDIIETDETYLLNKVNDLLKSEMGISQSQMQMAHEALREVMRDYGIGKMELPDGESIELKGGQLTLHGHNTNGTPADYSYNDLPHSRQSNIFNHVADNIQTMEERLAGEELKLAAMMVDMQAVKLYVDDAVATLYHVPDPKERQDIIVSAIRMDDEGALRVITDEDKEYPIENLHLPDRITVIDNAVRMVGELRQKEAEQALNPDESQRMTYPQYLQQLMQASKVQTLALYDGKVIDNKEGELIYSDLNRTIPFNDLPKEERDSLAWSGTELLVSHLESELEKFVRNTDAKEVSLPNGDTVTLDDSRSYDRLRFILHDPDENTHDYKAMEKHEKVEVLSAFADIAAQEARDLFMAHVTGREDGRLHIAPDNWIEQLPDSHLAIVRTDESGESKTLSFENVNGFTQLNVVSFAAEQQEILDRQQATEKVAGQTAQQQQPKGEEIPSPSAGNTLSAGEGRGETYSPLATDPKTDQSVQATQAPTDGLSPFQAYLTVHDAQALTRLMQEHQTDSVMLPWGDQVRLDGNGILMLHGHNEDMTPKVFPFSELSETQQEVFARHAAESLIKNAEQQSQAVPSPSASDSLSTGEGQRETLSPIAADLSQEADRLRERVAKLMAENEVINVSFEPTTIHPFATWQSDIYAGETQAMDGIHRDESGWLQMTDGNVLLNSVSEYLPQEQIMVLRKAEAAILQHLGQQQDSSSALQLDQAKIENFLGAEMLTRDRDAFLDKIRHNDNLMAVVEEKMDRRVQPNTLVTYAESELQAQEHRAVTMMKMLDEHAIPSWGGSYIEVKEGHLVWQKNDGSKVQSVLDMPGAIARTTLQMAIDDLTPQMEEKVKDLMAMEKDNVIPVNDLPVKVHTRDNDNNFHDAIVIPERIGFFSDDQIYVQDTEGVRHPLSSLHDESKILLLGDILQSSQSRSEEMDASVDNPLASSQQATETLNGQPAEKALVEQEQQRLMQIMRTANVSEVDLWDSDYSIEMADGRLTLAEYADGTTKRTSIPDLDTDAAMDTMGMAAAQITSNLKAALMDYMHDAGIKNYETDFKNSKATIDISHDDIQVQLGNDNAYMHINKLDDLTTTELLTKAISEVDDKYLKAWVGSQPEASLEDAVEAKGKADLHAIANPLADIKARLRDSGIIVMPVKFDTEDRHYMDTNGWVKTPFLDFSPKGSHRPETVIAPVSVEYQKASDTLLLHGKNANGDYLTLPLESPTKGNERAYTVIREQLEQPLQKAIENANMTEYFADSSLENGRVSDTFIRSITDTVLHAQNGNFIHVGDYDKSSGKLHVTEKNESGHTVNETWTDPMGVARMIAQKEAVAVSRWNLAEASLSYPTLDEVTQSRTAQKQSEQSKANEKYLYTLFENRDPHWNEKVVIISTDIDVTPWGKEVRLTGESNMGQMVFNPDDSGSRYAQTGNKIEGIITDISRLGFTDREKNMPYNLMDPISYCRDDGRIMGPDQIRYDGLMVDFGPNHFYFQQILSGPEEGRYRASYEIENLNHGTREKVVDADIDMVYERMRRFLSDYDLRENQPHSLHETEDLVRDITNHALDQMVTLGSRIYNIPTGDEEMADDPRYPVMDVSMIEVDRKGEIILHGNGGPAPLDSLDETARFEVLRRALNDMMDQNLDLQVKLERLMQHANANGHLTDIIMPFENPRTLYDKDGGRQSVGALIVDDLNNITLFHNVADAYDFLVRKDAGKDSHTDRTDFNDLSPVSQRKVLDGALDFYISRDLQQQAFREAEEHAERMTTRQYSSFTNNMSNPNSEEKIMRPEEQQPQVEQPKADQQQQAAASQSPTREQATEQIRAAIGPDQKVRLNENERVTLETSKGATINVQTVSITKNETVSLYGEIEGSKKSVSASQLTDDSLSKLASHLDDLRSARQSMAAEKPAEQKAQPAQEQQPAQTQQAKGEAIPAPAAEQKEQKVQEQAKGEAVPAAEQKAEQPRERKVEPIEIKPDSKVEFNITKNPVLDRVYDIQLFVDGEKKAGHHLSIEDRKDFFDKKVTGPELVPKYFEKELAGQKLPEVIERHHAERKQEAQEQKPAQEQKASEQKAEQPKERKAETFEIKPDSKVQVNVVPNKALDHVYDIQLYVDGQKQGRGHHLSIEDRKSFFDQKTPEEKTAFAASLLPKYFEKELAGQKLPDNIDRYRPEKKQEAQEQKPAQAAEQKPAQTADQKTEQKAGASPVDVWKDARGTGEQERMTFVQRDGQYGKFYQTYGADAAKVAQLTDKPTKEIKDGPNAQLAYINVKQADMPDLMKTMKEQEIPYKVVGMDGKYARVLPEAQAKTQAADLSGYKVPEGKQVTDVKVWQFQGKPFMNGVVDGVKLDAKEISKEDWTAFKGQKATPEQLVGKYYAPAEMENKQAQKQAKAMAR